MVNQIEVKQINRELSDAARQDMEVAEIELPPMETGQEMLDTLSETIQPTKSDAASRFLEAFHSFLYTCWKHTEGKAHFDGGGCYAFVNADCQSESAVARVEFPGGSAVETRRNDIDSGVKATLIRWCQDRVVSYYLDCAS